MANTGRVIATSYGTKIWLDEYDKRHREDGPAIEHYNGDKYWYKYDKCHREDGPAIEYINGNKEWWYEGKRLPPYVQSVEQLKSYIRNKVLWYHSW